VTTVDLRIPGDLYDRLLADVSKEFEWAGYLLCGVLHGSPDVLLGREWCPVPPAMQLKGTAHGFSWDPDFDVAMLNRMQRESLAGVVIHYHGGGRPKLSGDDYKTAESLMPFLSREAAGRPHAFIVLGNRAVSGSAYKDGVPIRALGTVRVASTWIDDWPDARSSAAPSQFDARHDRLVRGFGEPAFRRLRKANVGFIGCGGGASHIIQQLAYLGIGAMALADGDVVDITSLNRLIGALEIRPRRFMDRLLRLPSTDVGQLKVDVMSRMIDSIDNTIHVTFFPEFFPTARTVDALRRCDVLVSCVDKLQVRDDLNRFCKRYLIPMIDIGIEITPDRKDRGTIEAITGRVTKVLPAGPCLRCQGVIDDAKLAAERDGKPIGYAGTAGLPDPAVVTLNGIVASTAATEVLQLLTGYAGDSAPNCGWIYDGLTGEMERVAKSFTQCEACRFERGRGDS
jgi:molybdopterin-synthase adenylyltransferase